MAARKTSTRRRPSNRKGRGKANRHIMEARTKSIVFLNRGALVLLLILICVAVGVSVYPQWQELKRLEAELEGAQKAEIAALELTDQKTRELKAMREDIEFQETRGRDLIGLYVPGETIIRIRRD